MQVDETPCHLPGVLPQIHPKIGGYLIVTASPRPQLAPKGAEALEQTPFQGRVHVLIVNRRSETTGSHGFGQIVQGREDGGELTVVEQAGAVQHAGVRARGPQVVRGEPPVELDADRQARQRLRRTAGETTTPQPGRRRGRRWP